MNEYHEQDEILRLRSAAIKKVEFISEIISFIAVCIYLSQLMCIASIQLKVLQPAPLSVKVSCIYDVGKDGEGGSLNFRLF